MPNPRTTLKTPYIASGADNVKLGMMIFSFSLPAILSCPGATALCLIVCYALRGRLITKAVLTSQERNLLLAEDPAFDRVMIGALVFVRVLRLHVAGDFFSAAYVWAWTRIARACPGVQFYCYTRSWRVPELLEPLKALAALPNVSLFFSEDRISAGQSPHVPYVRVAFLLHENDDEALIPWYADLLFRTHRHRSLKLNPHPRKRIGGVLVCPSEQWWVHRRRVALRRTPPKVVCEKCRNSLFRQPSKRDLAAAQRA